MSRLARTKKHHQLYDSGLACWLARMTKGKLLRRVAWLVMAIFLTTNVLVDINLVGRPKETGLSRQAAAQSASPTTFYFKDDARNATTFGVTGPNNEESTDADGSGTNPTGKTTAYTVVPIAGPFNPTNTSDFITDTAVATTLLWYRTFIMPLASGMTFVDDPSGSTFEIGVSADESHVNANAYMKAFIYVYDSGSDSNVKTLAGPTQDTAEIGTSDNGVIWLITNAMSGNYTTNSNDFLAVELWVNTTGTTAYTVTLRWGGNVAIGDGTANMINPASYVKIGATTMDTFDPIYFLPTSIPPEPTPNDAQTGDSFRGGTSDIRRMSTVPGTVAEINITTVDTTAGNWKGNIFISPPLAAQTIPAGTWLIHLHANEADAGSNAQLRGMIYTWDADDTIGDTIIAVQNGGTEWPVDYASCQVEVTWTGAQTTISAGERLVAEWNIVTISPTVGGDVNQRFASPIAPSAYTYDSSILPPMLYSSSPAPLQWLPAAYDQTHFRFDEDDDGEVHTAWTDKNGVTAEDDDTVSYDANTKFRLRLHVNNTGGESDTLTPKLEFRINSPPGSWTEIIPNSGTIQIVASDYFTDGTVTTEQLSATSGYTFTAGQMEEDSSPSQNTTMNWWNSTEYEWSLKATVSGIYDLRMNDNGVAFGTYSKAPLLAIGYNPKMNNWRWYADEANITPLTSYAAENTAPPQEEMGKSIPMKLRINLREEGRIGENDSRKILQYSTSTGGPWTTVGTLADTIYPWRFYDGGGEDGATLPSKVLSDSSAVFGTHNEAVSGGQTNSDHPASTTVEWEFCIENYSADAATIYYFNLRDEILAADIPLYTGKSYPSLKTAAAYSLTISAPSAVYLGSWAIGSSAYASYTFVGGEEITIRDNRGQTSGNSSGWSATASMSTELNYRDPGTFGTPVFNGSGPNDILRQGSYTGSVDSSYLITITSNGTPDGASWSNIILGEGGFLSLSTVWQNVGSFGLGVRWGASIGHHIGDNWTISATAGTLWTITKDNMYWISDSITGLYAAPITGISTQPGSYMGSPVTAASVSGSGKNGLGGFNQWPTLRIYNAIHVGNYTGSITLTLT